MSAERQPDACGHLVLADCNSHEQPVWWERFGRGERDTVVLLNGLAMHTKAWYGFLDELVPDFDVLLYDYLGQGASSSPDQPVTIPELAAALVAILDHLAIDRVHVVGVSYGGFVAADFARLYPDRVVTVTLSGILLSHERQFELYQEQSLRFYASGRATFELYTHYLYEKIFGEPFLRALPATTLETMRQRFFERYVDRIHSLRRLTEAQTPFFAQLDEHLAGYRAVTAPVLVLAGDQDRAIPVWQQRHLVAIFPNLRFEVVPGCGHVVYLEDRRTFFGWLRDFAAARSTTFARTGVTQPAET